jgi:hypothetical protein
LIALVVAAFGCGNKNSHNSKEAPALRGLILGPVLADTSLKSVLPESSAVGLGAYDSAHKTSRDHFWLVDYVWFFLPHRPLEFKTFAEMHQMEAEGKIDSSTVVSTISYRYGVEAVDLEHLRSRSIELRPKVPPPALVKAVDAYVATHRVTAKPDSTRRH